MCFYYHLSKTAQDLENRYNSKFEKANDYTPNNYNGFSHPKTPVITNKQSSIIQLFTWGLIPFWAKDTDIMKMTLNAKIETIHQKPAFRNSVNMRCIIPAEGFYEWKWLDEKGKKKQKYYIKLKNSEIFSFAGLYSQWTNKTTGEILHTFTILTTSANELMSEIHNTKKRMPVILNYEDEINWLKGELMNLKNVDLIACYAE